jgi:hypothetical protein
MVEGETEGITMRPRDYKKTTLFRQWKDKLEVLETKQYLPAKKYPYLLLRFYDTYT